VVRLQDLGLELVALDLVVALVSGVVFGHPTHSRFVCPSTA
jgi:hypothetical protein